MVKPLVYTQVTPGSSPGPPTMKLGWRIMFNIAKEATAGFERFHVKVIRGYPKHYHDFHDMGKGPPPRYLAIVGPAKNKCAKHVAHTVCMWMKKDEPAMLYMMTRHAGRKKKFYKWDLHNPECMGDIVAWIKPHLEMRDRR